MCNSSGMEYMFVKVVNLIWCSDLNSLFLVHVGDDYFNVILITGLVVSKGISSPLKQMYLNALFLLVGRNEVG